MSDSRVPAAPDALMRLCSAPRALAALEAALELGIFESLATTAETSESTSEKLNLDAKATKSLMNTMVSLTLLAKNDERYSLTEISRCYLLEESDYYMGLYMKHAEELMETWSCLGDVVRTGKPKMQINEKSEAERFFPSLAESIFPMSYATACLVADELSGVNKGAVQIMDLAAGSGVWSIPFAENNPSAHIDAVDFQAILAVTEKITKKRELFSQYSFLPGDWRDIEWKSSFYDIITLGHILHSEGEFESKKLLAKCFEALKVGGKIVVAEFLCNELRDGPVPALLFELNMLLHTRDGCVFSVDHLSELVYDVGFKRPVTYSAVIDGKPILIGTK